MLKVLTILHFYILCVIIGKYHKGKHVEGRWVFGGVERETGKCFLIPVPDRRAETLIRLIQHWIKPGTTIISDCWKAYNSLKLVIDIFNFDKNKNVLIISFMLIGDSRTVITI